MYLNLYFHPIICIQYVVISCIEAAFCHVDTYKKSSCRYLKQKQSFKFSILQGLESNDLNNHLKHYKAGAFRQPPSTVGSVTGILQALSF